MTEIRSIAVFCASSEAAPQEDRRVAAELGKAIAAEGWRLVYGGGNVGLMGEVARAALAGGAHVTGVIPHRLAERELALEEVDELIHTETMRERKGIMDERSDAFIVLAGGIGTLEELVEIITLKQLGFHQRAVLILDPRGYWGPLCDQFERMVDEAFADPGLLRLWEVVTDVPATIEALRTYQPTPPAPTALEEVEAAADERGLG